MFQSQAARTLRSLLFSGLFMLVTLNSFAQDAAEPTFAEETARIAEVLQLAAGMTVADVGAGDGKYAAFLADQVGSSGRVYATEIEQSKVDEIGKTVAGKTNVTVILGKAESTELPEQCCDRILLRRVFHHMHHPEPMLKSLLASLKPGGVIAVIDFLPRHDMPNQDGTPEDHEHGTSVEKLTEHFTAAGFELAGQVEDWPSRIEHGKSIDYAVVYRRP
jgi:ubiquinone/menaquinone biosynthesis C-methylase UbiE